MDGRWRGRLVAGLVGVAVVAAVACSDGGSVDSDTSQVGGAPAAPGSEPPVTSGNTGNNPVPTPGNETPGGGGDGDGDGEGGGEDGKDPGHEEPTDAGEPTVDTGKPQTDLVEAEAPAGGWTFYTQANGAPRDVYGVSEDEGGNLWVAGGSEGLFLLRKGATRFERFGMEHGLQPYGLWRGKVPVGEKKLKVLAVTGGPAGTVFVGYEGIQTATADCESEFYKDDGTFEDPNVFKSGDADRVELQPDGTLRVVHYDIHSVAHSVPGYGHREKICTVHRIIWDKARNSLWFAGNHGFSWGEADYQGAPECSDPEVRAANEWTHVAPDGGATEVRQRCKHGVMEHVHPSIFSPPSRPGYAPSLIAGSVRGVAVMPNGDVWFGTAIRTSLFRIMTNGAPRWARDAYVADGAPWDFEAARKLSADRSKWKNRIDIWPDLDSEPMKTLSDPEPNGLFTRAERRDDEVSGMALMSDNTLWVSSRAWGLAQLDAKDGTVLRRLFEGTTDARLSALGRDTYDESLWLGHENGAGLSRIQGGKLLRYGDALGALGSRRISDIQFVGTGRSRRVLVGFSASGGGAGGVGVYGGE